MSFSKSLTGNGRLGGLDVNKYQKRGGLYYYKGKLLVNPASTLTQTLMSEHHDTPEGGHSGYEKTWQRLKRAVYWKGMKGLLKQFIRQCDVCQRS